MERSRLISATLLGTLAVSGVFASVSTAARFPKTVIPYTATYTDQRFGPVTCEGKHETARAYQGTETSGGRDVCKCRSTTGKPLTNAVPGEYLSEVSVASDYFYYVKGLEVDGHADMVVNAKATGYSAVGYWQ